MGVLSVIQLILGLLGGVSAVLTKNNAPAEVIAGIQTAINEISKVHGTVVTKAQVDSLLDTPQW